MGMTVVATTQPAISRRSLVVLWTGLLLLTATVLLVGLRSSLSAANTQFNALVAMASLVLAAAAVGAPSRRWLGAPMIYLGIFAIFHLGLAPIIVFGGQVPDFGNPFGARWLSSGLLPEAFYVVSVSLLCFALGARAGCWIGRRRSTHSALLSPDTPAAERRCATLALGSAVLGVGGWFVFVLVRGGVNVFAGSYGTYLEATGSGALPQLYLLITLAAALSAVAPAEPSSRLALGLLAVFAVVALPLGLRGEILFPLAAAVALTAKRRWLRPRPLRWLGIAIVLLSVVALARSVRSTGIADVGEQPLDINPVHGIAELGYSLRPVVEALRWQETIDRPANGRTYIRPLERAASRVLPWVDVPPGEDDELLMNVLISDRVGPIGFSPVAEGVVNFGLAGAAGYLGIVGAVLGFLDRRPGTTGNLVLTAVVLVPLLIQTRNSFVPVPLQLFLGLVIWLLVFRPRRHQWAAGKQPVRGVESGEAHESSEPLTTAP